VERGGVRRGWERSLKVSAPALAFLVTYETTYVPADEHPELRAHLLRRWEECGKPFQQHRIAHLVRDMRKGEVIELHDAEHGDFLQAGAVQTRTVREMRRFLFSEP
jgi:hypothetical protein